ncbi:hypothetical protein GCM10027174_19260 [Salinifilum aidingensis]
MGYLYATDYAPAHAHEGYLMGVLGEGAEQHAPIHAPPEREQLAGRVTGWRVACVCGWRGPHWPRTDVPTPDDAATPPEALEESAATAWRGHVHTVLPALAVYETATRATADRAELDAAVTRARAAGASWNTIGTATGMSRRAAHERWGD